MSEVPDTLREAAAELGEAVELLPPGSPGRAERVALILDRVAEEIREAAAQIRQEGQL